MAGPLSPTQTVSIMAGDSLSGVIDCSATSPVRVQMPLNWTGGPRGIVTFQVSPDNVTFRDYFDSHGQEISATVIPGTTVRIDFAIGGSRAPCWIKFRSGTRNEPIVQQQQADFVVVMQTPGPP